MDDEVYIMLSKSQGDFARTAGVTRISLSDWAELRHVYGLEWTSMQRSLSLRCTLLVLAMLARTFKAVVLAYRNYLWNTAVAREYELDPFYLSATSLRSKKEIVYSVLSQVGPATPETANVHKGNSHQVPSSTTNLNYPIQ